MLDATSEKPPAPQSPTYQVGLATTWPAAAAAAEEEAARQAAAEAEAAAIAAAEADAAAAPAEGDAAPEGDKE